jgi:carbon-monoxide dehydrogenase medium subunit
VNHVFLALSLSKGEDCITRLRRSADAVSSLFGTVTASRIPVKPAPFEYVAVESWDAAVAALAEHGDEARILAGGQSLVPTMNFRLARPEVLVDVNRIADAGYLRLDGDTLRVGALTRHVAFEAPGLNGPWGRLFPRVAHHIAHLPIRMRGTFGGSLAHADPSSEWCLLARSFDATMAVRSAAGERRIAAADWFEAALTTALDEGEALVSVDLPALGPDWCCGFVEFSRRAGDFAIVAALAALEIRDGRIVQARIGIGGACEVPQRVVAAEAALTGAAPDAAAFAAAGEAAAETTDDLLADHHASAGLRRDLVRALVPRALADATAGSGQGEAAA